MRGLARPARCCLPWPTPDAPVLHGLDALVHSGYNMSYVAYFSSLGPASDGRIKPDIVAPGSRLYSAQSGSDCSVVAMQGTGLTSSARESGDGLAATSEGWRRSSL